MNRKVDAELLIHLKAKNIDKYRMQKDIIVVPQDSILGPQMLNIFIYYF